MIQFTTKVDGSEGLRVSIPHGYEAAVAVLLEKSKMKHAGYLNVKLDLPHRPRTTGWKSQNHHLRGHARQLGELTGYTMSEIMQLIKEDTLTWPVEFRIVRGKRRMFHASEADISMEVATEAIETCHRFAAENGWLLKEDNE